MWNNYSWLLSVCFRVRCIICVILLYAYTKAYRCSHIGNKLHSIANRDGHYSMTLAVIILIDLYQDLEHTIGTVFYGWQCMKYMWQFLGFGMRSADSPNPYTRYGIPVSFQKGNIAQTSFSFVKLRSKIGYSDLVLLCYKQLYQGETIHKCITCTKCFIVFKIKSR